MSSRNNAHFTVAMREMTILYVLAYQPQKRAIMVRLA